MNKSGKKGGFFHPAVGRSGAADGGMSSLKMMETLGFLVTGLDLA